MFSYESLRILNPFWDKLNSYGVVGSILSFTFFIIAMVVFISIIKYVLLAIANYKLFKKMGIEGWKAFVPFYNTYLQFKNVWNVQPFYFSLIIPIISGIFSGFAKIPHTPGGLIITIMMIQMCFNLLQMAINVVYCIYFAEAFGQSRLYGVVLFFFNIICRFIMAFSKNIEYVGNNNEDKFVIFEK